MENTQLDQPKKEKKPIKPILLLCIIALASLLATTLLRFIPNFIAILEYGYNFKNAMNILASTLANGIALLLCGLLLPVSLFLLDTNTAKARFAKIFLGVSAAFLLVQLFSVLIMAILALANTTYGPLRTMMSSVSGSTLLANVIYMFKALFQSGSFIHAILGFLRYLLNCLCDLLYIVSTAVCAFGFFKMSDFNLKK